MTAAGEASSIESGEQRQEVFAAIASTLVEAAKTDISDDALRCVPLPGVVRPRPQDSNNGKFRKINGRFNALFDPAYKQGVCYYTVKHPTFKKVAV